MAEGRKMKITVLCNDNAQKPFFSEHGFSALVKTKKCSVLFDTGSTDVFLKNMQILGLNPALIQNVVLSHGHHDHVGGLRHLIGKSDPKVWVKGDIFLSNFSGKRFAGIDWKKLKGTLRLSELESNVQRICDSIFAWGPAPMANEFEEPDSKFWVMRDGEFERNLFQEELSLTIEEEQGLIILSGCAHRGIANIAYGAQRLFGKRVLAIIGGFHLFNAPLKKIQYIIDYFNEIGVEVVVPCHCTGEGAIKLFQEEFKGKVLNCQAGTEIILPLEIKKGTS